MGSTVRTHRNLPGTQLLTAAFGCAIATWSACSPCCKLATRLKFTGSGTSRLHRSSETALRTRPSQRSKLQIRTAGNRPRGQRVCPKRIETKTEFSGAHHANGNHIHGGGGRNDFFAGDRITGRGTDFRTSVPVVFCPAGGCG